jgi:hypothetical protein
MISGFDTELLWGKSITTVGKSFVQDVKLSTNGGVVAILDSQSTTLQFLILDADNGDLILAV